MMTRRRFLAVSPFPSLILLSLLLATALVSCSGKGQGTVAPPITVDDQFAVNRDYAGFRSGHNIMGVCSVYFDPATWTTQVVFKRSAEIHINLSSFLNHPNCPGGSCLNWYVTGYDSTRHVYMIDMVLFNPTSFAAYDMRVIFEGLPINELTGIGWEVMNPDSYTNVWDPDPEWDEDEQWLNPFIAFEKEDLDRLFKADPDGGGPGTYSDTERLLLRVPPESGASGEIEIVIDACWPGHCNEPYQIIRMSQSNPLPPLNIDPTSTVLFEAIIADWQQNIQNVSLYVPDIIGDTDDGFIVMYEWPTTGPNAWPPEIGMPPWTEDQLEFLIEFSQFKYETLRKYWCVVANEERVPAGEYPAIVVAQSDDPDGQDFDTVYNRYEFNVDIGGSGGDEQKNLMIVFSSYRNGTDADIYCYLFKNNKTYQLTSDVVGSEPKSDELEPCVNEKGDRIVFISNFDRLTGEIGDFDLYMLDTNLIFAGGATPKTVNRTSWIPVTNTDFTDERMPDFSRTQDTNKDDLAYCSDEFSQFEIFTLNTRNISAGTNRVTFNYALDQAPNWDRYDPNAEWLYFHSDRAGGGNVDIYGLNGREQESSSNVPERYTTHQGFDGYPASQGPGGPAIAWVSDRAGDYDILYSDFVEDVVNLIKTKYPEDVNMDNFPSFSTDGTWIAFMSDRSNLNMDIWRMTYQGGSPSRITNDDMPDIDPCYGGG